MAAKTTARLQGPGDLLSNTWKTFTAKYQNFLLAALPVAVASFLMTLTVRPYRAHHLPPFSSPLMFIFTIILAVVSIVGAIALLYTAAGTKEPVDAYQKGLNKFFPYLGVQIVHGLIILGGLILLVVPGIIFGIWFCFAGYILVLENKGIIASLGQSKKYVTGNWWSVLGRIIILVVVLLILRIAGAVVAFVFTPLHFLFVPQLIIAAVNLVAAPFGVIYLYLLYKNLKNLS